MGILQAIRAWNATRAPWALTGGDLADGVPVMIGHTARVCRWPLGVGSLLIAGSTGSGKSTTLRFILANLAERTDVALFGIDLKGGVELAPWAPRMEAVVTSRDSAAELLMEVRKLIETRLAILLAANRTEWDIKDGPYVVVVVDELAEAVEAESANEREAANAVKALLVSIARTGRATGVHLIAATQRPDTETLSGALRGQFDWRIGLRMRDPNESRLLCPMETADLTTLAGRGEAFYIPPLPYFPASGRAPFIHPALVPGIAEAAHANRPSIGVAPWS